MKIHFLCVGFAKCGTTTLDSILRQYKQINLPVIKEPHFFEWNDKFHNSLDILYEEYFVNVKPEQCVGMVDPSLAKTPIERMDSFFGSQNKIIIMLRNPVKALFSDFRMGLRRGFYWGYFSPFKKDSVNDKFNRFMDHCINKQHDWRKAELFCYDKYLESVYACRSKEDIKVIIFEEFIKNPEGYKAELEEFLGVKPEENIDYNVWSNDGKKISRNYFCARINNFVLQIENSRNLKINNLGKKLRKIDKFTLITDSEKILPEIQKKCEVYYRNSVAKTAEIIGKDLSGLWFDYNSEA